MARYQDKDRRLKLAAAAVSLVTVVGLVGALLVRSPIAVVALLGAEAVILIGTGVLLNKMDGDKVDPDKGH